MSPTALPPAAPYDVVLCVVIAADAALSAVAALAGLATPLVALVPVTRGAAAVIGLVALAAALVLAGLGAVTAVLLALRVRAGHADVPRGLRLPLPAAMVPELVRSSARTRRTGCDHAAS